MMKRARTTIVGVTAAAMLATTSVVAVPAASAASAGVYGEAPIILASHRDDDWRWKKPRRPGADDFPAAIFGFAAGAFVGSMLSQPQPRYYADADSYCAAKFKTYKPWTGTYRGYDGYEHPCP